MAGNKRGKERAPRSSDTSTAETLCVCRDSQHSRPSLRALPSHLPASIDNSPPTAPDLARARRQIYWKLPTSPGIETSLNPYLPPSPSPRGHAEEQATQSGGEGLVACRDEDTPLQSPLNCQLHKRTDEQRWREGPGGATVSHRSSAHRLLPPRLSSAGVWPASCDSTGSVWQPWGWALELGLQTSLRSGRHPFQSHHVHVHAQSRAGWSAGWRARGPWQPRAK